MRTIRDRLERSHADRLGGRERELAQLATLFERGGPIVVLLHGVAGIGKTSLVRAFERQSAARGRQVRLLDCRGVEPVPLRLLGAIGTSLGADLRNVSEAAAVIGALAEPMVFALDNYEALRLLDGWLRTEFLPALPISARFIIMGRSLATAPWITAPGWADYVLSLRLGPLAETDVAAFLAAYFTLLAPVQLSFVEAAADGLVFHDAFRLAIESRVAAMDPVRTRKLKLAAWQCMRDQLLVAGGRDTWRHTADLLFLLERPVLREAFFPSGTTLPVERARPTDRDPILEIARIHDGDSGAAIMSEWWKQASPMFSVVRGSAGEVVGFYVMARPQDIPRSLAECDPLLAAWLGHVLAQGNDPRRPYLLMRCLLSRALGERQSPEWAACVLDAKRAYLENPRAVAVFTAIREPASVPQAVMDLGFDLEPSLTVSIGESLIHTAVLAFGPQGPMQWILEFVGRDLSRESVGSSKSQVELDVSRRQLAICDGGRLNLTKLEFELMLYLSQRPGSVVTRDELLREVWKQPFGGSNVVDVVVRGLRRKLGRNAWVIGTVKGHGYQYNDAQS